MAVQSRAFLGCVAYESKSCHEGLRDEEAAADEPPSNHIDCEDGVSPLPADYRQHADSHVPRVDEVRYAHWIDGVCSRRSVIRSQIYSPMGNLPIERNYALYQCSSLRNWGIGVSGVDSSNVHPNLNQG